MTTTLTPGEDVSLGLYLPYISPISPLYLPYISPVSPLYLPYISQVRGHPSLTSVDLDGAALPVHQLSGLKRAASVALQARVLTL